MLKIKVLEEIRPYNSTETKKIQVENMFDSIAPKYDLLNSLLSLRIDVFWRKMLVKWLKKTKPELVLDVATGTGDLAITICKELGIRVVGLDLSQRMLNVGIEKVKALNLQNQISMLKGDAENLPFEDNQFDAVSVAFGVRNFENLEKGLEELKRVVKEKSNVYILEFSQVEGFFAPFYLFYFKYILPKIGQLISKDSQAYSYLPYSVHDFPYGEKMRNILLKIGFSKVEYKKLSLGIVTIYKATK